MIGPYITYGGDWQPHSTPVEAGSGRPEAPRAMAASAPERDSVNQEKFENLTLKSDLYGSSS